MNRASWIILALGIGGVVTVILAMKKKCSCNGSTPLADPNLEVVDLGDGTEALIDSNNNVVASKSYSDTNFTTSSRLGGSTLGTVKAVDKNCSSSFPHMCPNGYCVKDENSCW